MIKKGVQLQNILWDQTKITATFIYYKEEPFAEDKPYAFLTCLYNSWINSYCREEQTDQSARMWNKTIHCWKLKGI